MVEAALVSWLDPNVLLGDSFGWVLLLIVCGIVFAETGLLFGFLFPGDTLLFFAGVLSVDDRFGMGIGWVCLAIAAAAFLGGEVGYLIGKKFGPRVFERRESGLFSVESVKRTNAFFEKHGGLAVILARFVPIVRTFAPVAAGVGRMDYRRYTLFNLIGALIWGAGLTLAGNLLGRIPFVRDFANDYLDVVLIGVVLLTLVPTLWHYFQARRKAKLAGARSANHPETVAAAEQLVRHREVLEPGKPPAE